MMSFSIAFSQALEMTAYVGIKSQEEQYDYLSIQKISEKLNIPIPSIKKISSLLTKNGILRSKTGIYGGLRLAKQPKEITVYDVLMAIEGTGQLFVVHKDFDTSAFVHQDRVNRWLENSSKVLNQAEEAMLTVLKKTSLEDIGDMSE
ncbi:MAG: Rrf2 family transcriptional regulator [Lentilactobacillus diolivorans]|uniref:RrF2 family transcriptional regulator n=1 Tax=Lentilactobacillus diolivorans TaxID=179838 RepID=UPI0039EBB970